MNDRITELLKGPFNGEFLTDNNAILRSGESIGANGEIA
jgi:hypothetical protein